MVEEWNDGMVERWKDGDEVGEIVEDVETAQGASWKSFLSAADGRRASGGLNEFFREGGDDGWMDGWMDGAHWTEGKTRRERRESPPIAQNNLTSTIHREKSLNEDRALVKNFLQKKTLKWQIPQISNSLQTASWVSNSHYGAGTIGVGIGVGIEKKQGNTTPIPIPTPKTQSPHNENCWSWVTRLATEA
ncbi:MAG: hypothetical protein U1E27_14205 [Kiritimatiellia bacterium]|nr:hypothetical protein [Kiritimatiellia bacterium]